MSPKRWLKLVREGVSRAHFDKRTESITQKRGVPRSAYDEFREFTMIPPEVFEANLILAERIRLVPGCIVECGVWRGGMSAAIAKILGQDRRYFLCDSFEGLPPATPIDGESAIAWQANADGPFYFNNCTAVPEFADEAMKRANVEYTLVKGWFADTLPTLNLPEAISLLRLDADWYDSTMTCLQSLFDKVAPNGLIVIDDYYTWDGCSRAVHDFLSRRSAVERIQNLNGVCFIEKAGATTIAA